MVVQWTTNDTATPSTVIPPSNVPKVRWWSFCGNPLRRLLQICLQETFFLLFWILIKNKLSMKSTFGKHKQVRQVRGVWRRGNQNPSIEEEQTTQWLREKVQKDKQWSTKHTYITKDRVTRTPLKTVGKLRCSGRVGSSFSTSGTRRVNLVTNPVISREWGKDREVFTTSGTIRGHLWHRYSITINRWRPKNFRSDDFNFTKKEPLVQ